MYGPTPPYVQIALQRKLDLGIKHVIFNTDGKERTLERKSRMAGKSRMGKSLGHWSATIQMNFFVAKRYFCRNRRRSNEVQSNMDLVHVKSTDLLRLWARQKDNYSIISQSWVYRVTEARAVLNYSLQVSTVVSYMHHWLLSLFFFFFSFSSNLLFSFTRHCSLRGISHQRVSNKNRIHYNKMNPIRRQGFLFKKRESRRKYNLFTER